jgi:ABC-2 type transporter.
MRVLATIPFTLLRMVRSYIVLLLLLAMPILLLTVFAFILKGAVTETGEPYLYQTAITMVLTFQLFGGSIVMSYIQTDFFSEFRARIFALPFNRTMYAFSIMMCGTVYSILMGLILMAYTQFVLGVAWTNWLWAIYILSLMSILSSVVYLIITFAVKSFKTAERLSVLYGVSFVTLAGLFFPMPDNAFFRFMGSYGNPLALSVEAVLNMSRSNSGGAWFQANLLLAVTVVLFALMLLVGRRRMA